jgi:hypothetical protein
MGQNERIIRNGTVAGVIILALITVVIWLG